MYISPKAAHFEFQGNGCTPTDFLQHRWQIARRVEQDFPDLVHATKEDVEALLDREIRPNLPEGATLIFNP